jgi:hypothetical protein
MSENERRGSSTIGMRRSLLDGECTMARTIAVAIGP